MKHKFRSLRGGQKPQQFIDCIVCASTDRCVAAWAPFVQEAA